MFAAMGHGHGGHSHGVRRRRRPALADQIALILTFMAAEVVVGIIAESLALISDAGAHAHRCRVHCAGPVGDQPRRPPGEGPLDLWLKRAEILSAQANGLTLLLLAAWFSYEAIRRLFDPPDVAGTVGVRHRTRRHRRQHRGRLAGSARPTAPA